MSLWDSSHTSPIKLLPVMHLADETIVAAVHQQRRQRRWWQCSSRAAAAAWGWRRRCGDSSGSAATMAAAWKQGDGGRQRQQDNRNSAAAVAGGSAVAARWPAWQLGSSSAAIAWCHWQQHRGRKRGSWRQRCPWAAAAGSGSGQCIGSATPAGMATAAAAFLILSHSSLGELWDRIKMESIAWAEAEVLCSLKLQVEWMSELWLILFK